MYKRILPTVILIAYSALLIKLLVFKEVSFTIGHLMFNFSGGGTGPANFVPMKTIVPYLLGAKGGVIGLFELAGNIVLLIPIGCIVPFIYEKMSWKKSLVLAISAPLIIEVVQVVLRTGTFDIDDIILNALGVMIGYGIYIILKKLRV